MKTITESQLRAGAAIGAIRSLRFSPHGSGWSLTVTLKRQDEKALLITHRKGLCVWKSLDRAIKHLSKFYAPATDVHLEIRL